MNERMTGLSLRYLKRPLNSEFCEKGYHFSLEGRDTFCFQWYTKGKVGGPCCETYP